MDDFKKLWSKYIPFVQMLLAVGLLFLILILNTYLSRLSLTGDFDGMDLERIKEFKYYLNSPKFLDNPNPDTTIINSLKKFIIDTMQTEVIVRDYESKGIPDTAQINKVINDKFRQRRYAVFFWSRNLDTMLLLRERDFKNVFNFWPLYIKITNKYASEHGYIRLGTHILISPVLYFSIFILAMALTLMIVRRLWKKFCTVQFEQEIEPYLPPQFDQSSLKQIFDKFKKKSIGIGIVQCINKLLKSPKLTQNSFDMLVLEDDNETEHFTRTTDLITTWILRLGILGTLMGIMLAFYEVAKAVTLIQPGGGLSIEFRHRIREALTGHAVAVVTALAAQTASILFEIVSLRGAGKSLSKDWLLKNSKPFMDDNHSCDIKDLCLQLRKDLTDAITEIREFGNKFKEANISIKDFPSKTDDVMTQTGRVIQHLEGINTNLGLTKETSDKIVGSVTNSLGILDSIKDLLIKMRDRLISFNRCIAMRILRLCATLKITWDGLKTNIDKIMCIFNHNR